MNVSETADSRRADACTHFGSSSIVLTSILALEAALPALLRLNSAARLPLAPSCAAQPPLVWRCTRWTSPPTAARSGSTAGTPRGRRSLAACATATTSTASAPSSCLTSPRASHTRTCRPGTGTSAGESQCVTAHAIWCMEHSLRCTPSDAAGLVRGRASCRGTGR